MRKIMACSILAVLILCLSAQNLFSFPNYELKLDDSIKQEKENQNNIQENQNKNSNTHLADRDQIKQKYKKTIKNLIKSEDKIQGTTWYKSKKLENSPIVLYIGTNGINTWLCYKILYKNDSWVFWKTCIFYIDGTTIEFTPQKRPEHEVIHGGVLEWVTEPIRDNDEQILKNIIRMSEGKDTILRFIGKQHHYDIKVNKNIRSGLRDVLDAYKGLTGEELYF